MKRLFYSLFLLPVVFNILVAVAHAGIRPACNLWVWHQPEVPKSLRK
ncbi:MAG: cyclic lactone autoinducer peptide [Bacillota bacterium]